MRLFRQLELPFRGTDILSVGLPGVPPGRSTGRMPVGLTAETAVPRRSGQDADTAPQKLTARFGMSSLTCWPNFARVAVASCRTAMNGARHARTWESATKRAATIFRSRLANGRDVSSTNVQIVSGTSQGPAEFVARLPAWRVVVRTTVANSTRVFGCALSPPPNRILSAESVPPWRSMNQDSFERKRRTPNAQHRTPN